MTLCRRTTVAALVAALCVLGACGNTQSEDDDASSGGCYGPWLESDAVGEPPGGPVPDPVATIRPGQTLTFYGHGYASTCHDTGGQEAEQPRGPVHLTVAFPGGETAELGELTPRVNRDNTDVGFVASVAVPPGTPNGIAVVSDNLSPATEYRFAIED